MKYPTKILLIQLTLFAGIILTSLIFKPEFGIGEAETSVTDIVVAILLLIFIFNVIFGLLKEIGMRIMLLLFYFVSITYFLNRFIGIIAPILSLVILAIKSKSFDVIYHDLTEAMACIGFVWLLNPALPNMIFASAFAIGLAIYDFISVFKTKHMIKMLKTQMKIGMPTALIVPYSKNKAAILGGGDVIVPSLLSLAALESYGMIRALAIIVGACVGLLVLQIFGRRKKVYPALPSIVGFSLLAFAFSLLFK